VPGTNQNKYFFLQTEIKALTGWSVPFAIVPTALKGLALLFQMARNRDKLSFFKNFRVLA